MRLLLPMICAATLLAGCASNADYGPANVQDMAGSDLGAGADLGLFPLPVRAIALSAGAGPRAVAVLDLEEDGAPDIVVANGLDDTVSVHRNRTQGQFGDAERTIHPVGRSPSGLAVGDVSGDALPDILVTCAGSDELTVLANQGGGVFPMDKGKRHGAGRGPGALILGDLDGNRSLDVALVGAEAALVLLNQGMGFAQKSTYPAGRFLYGLALLPRGGRADLLVASADTDRLRLLRNDGAGRFALDEAADLQTGQVPTAMLSTDLSGDGLADVAVANYGSDTVTVLLQQGPRFVVTHYPVGRRPVALVVSDLNDDGQPDLTAANQDSDDVTVLLGGGRGAFVPYRIPIPVERPVAMGTGDLNGDRRADLVVASQGGQVLVLMSQN